MTVEQYKQQIKGATSKKELDDIHYKACLEDRSGLLDFSPTFSVKPKTLYERICRLIHKRGFELGFLDAEAYVKTDENGNYVDKEQLARLKREFYSSMKEIFAACGI